MSRRCCIAICANAKVGADRTIAYHPFPADDAELRARWIEFVGVNQARFRWRSKYVCSAHFRSLDMRGDDDKLLDGAVPTIYNSEGLKNELEVDEEEFAMISDADRDGKVEANEVDVLDATLRTRFCRICIRRKQNLIPLESKLIDTPLVEVIYKISGLEIVPSEELPTGICESCIEKVDSAFNVYTELNNNALMLKNLVDNKQIESHYKFYDENPMGCHEDFLIALSKWEQEEAVPEVPETEIEVTLEMNSNDSTENEDAEIEELADKQPAVTSEKKTIPERPKLKRSKKIACKISEERPAAKLVPNTCYICANHSLHADTAALHHHLEVHLAELPYTCASCHMDEYPAVFRTLLSLNRHLMQHLYPYNCDYCWTRSNTLPAYRRHIQNRHEALSGDGFTCDTCGVRLTSRDDLQHHLNKHRALERQRYKCRHCGKLFTGEMLLTRHERIHTGEKPFQCGKCGKRFNHEYNMQIHFRRHIGEFSHTCKECGKGFYDAFQMKQHMGTHFPLDPKYRKKKPSVIKYKEYHCEAAGCDFMSTAYIQFYNHRKGHNRQPVCCEICQKPFQSRASLRYHVRTIHEGIPPKMNYRCGHCPKAFRSRPRLLEHVNMHDNIRTYQCQHCEKAFAQKGDCDVHERLHTGERPYQCRICTTEWFISATARTKHEKRQHPKKSE